MIMLFSCVLADAQDSNSVKPSRYDTLNGSVTEERKWWDILHYDLTIIPDYESNTIRGKNVITYSETMKTHTALMQIDLVAPLKIDSVFQNGRRINYTRDENIWYLQLPAKRTHHTNTISIYYSGKPTVSVKPPWDGGLVWSHDSLNRPWISVACQYKGASLWFPCKNTMYDEPDNGVSVTLVVPDTLIGVSNGRLIAKQENADHTTTYQWEVVNPISHYAISFYTGKYINIGEEYNGKDGMLSMDYWVLDYNRQKAIDHMIPEVNTAMKSFEHWFGPYPFYKDGFKMVDAPYIGMEHQSAIAYGSTYIKGTNKKGSDISNTGWGTRTDKIIMHEMAHEWFGNNITAIDIADRWIQEGFAGLGEELVIADLCGKEAGNAFLAGRFRTIENDKPVIARYGINEDGSQDNYMKGWALLHMIRAIIDNDDRFRSILVGLNNHFHNKVVTSKDIEDYISKKAGTDFRYLFDQYLRTASVPVLTYKIEGNKLFYCYANCNKNFVMPVKTNLTRNSWIYPSIEWQSVDINTSEINDTLVVANDFYIGVRRSE